MIIGHKIYKELFDQSSDPIGKKIKIKGINFLIVGVIEEQGESFVGGDSFDRQMFIPFNSFKKIYRVGKKFLKEKEITTESKRMVLPVPLTLDKTWNVDSETYLILRKYPYYDYRATTNFKLNYKVASMKETVNTPSGTFKDCILIIGNGKTNII